MPVHVLGAMLDPMKSPGWPHEWPHMHVVPFMVPMTECMQTATICDPCIALSASAWLKRGVTHHLMANGGRPDHTSGGDVVQIIVEALVSANLVHLQMSLVQGLDRPRASDLLQRHQVHMFFLDARVRTNIFAILIKCCKCTQLLTHK